MKKKTATECWNILRRDLDSLTVMFMWKSKGNGLRRNICLKRRSERLDINKICGGFINIRKRINIMKFTQYKIRLRVYVRM